MTVVNNDDLSAFYDGFMFFTQPPPAQKKHTPPPAPPAPPKVKHQEVGIGNLPVAMPPDMYPGLFDYDDHDDDDYPEDDSDTDEDDDVPVFHNGRSKMSLPRKPVLPGLQKPLPPPTRQPRVTAPSGGVRAGGGVVRGGGGVANAVGRPVNRPSTYMTSLPAACLLSDALIACGSTGLTRLPLIKDAGIRTLYLAGELAQTGRHAD